MAAWVSRRPLTLPRAGGVTSYCRLAVVCLPVLLALDGINGRSGGVSASGRGGPGVLAELALLKSPAASLFRVMVVAAEWSMAAHAGQPKSSWRMAMDLGGTSSSGKNSAHICRAVAEESIPMM